MTAPRDERAEREREVARVHDEAVDDVKHLAGPYYRISRWRETEELPRQWTLAFADRLLATSRARLERVVEGLREHHQTWCPFGKMAGVPCTCGANAHNAALDAVRTAMQGEG